MLGPVWEVNHAQVPDHIGQHRKRLDRRLHTGRCRHAAIQADTAAR